MINMETVVDYATHSDHDSVYARCDCARKN